MSKSAITRACSSLLVLGCLGLSPCVASGQWTIQFTFDQQNAVDGIGEPRIDAMIKALNRAKKKLEEVLGSSTGNVSFAISWDALPGVAPAIVASAQPGTQYDVSVANARLALINKATADDEPNSEIVMYQSLPTSSVPFLYDTAQVRTATVISLQRPLNQHLGAATILGGSSDGIIRIRPEAHLPFNRRWQLWPGKLKGPPDDEFQHESFELVIIHETLHLLGFVSIADFSPLSANLAMWDLFRVADSAVPISQNDFASVSRELRPTEPASWITLLGSSSNAYKASSGTRTGGDGNGAAHWKTRHSLTPMDAIGVMDPAGGDFTNYDALGGLFMSRADVEALDTMGWNVDPDVLNYAAAMPVNLISPTSLATVRAGHDLTFQWDDQATVFNGWTLFIYEGAQALGDMPLRVYEDIFATELTIPAAESLEPGEYVWYVVGGLQLGYSNSEDRRFTVAVLCPGDYNEDSSVDLADLIAFNIDWQPNIGQSVKSGAMGDYNGDGFVDLADLIAFNLDWQPNIGSTCD